MRWNPVGWRAACNRQFNRSRSSLKKPQFDKIPDLSFKLGGMDSLDLHGGFEPEVELNSTPHLHAGGNVLREAEELGAPKREPTLVCRHVRPRDPQDLPQIAQLAPLSEDNQRSCLQCTACRLNETSRVRTRSSHRVRYKSNSTRVRQSQIHSQKRRMRRVFRDRIRRF